MSNCGPDGPDVTAITAHVDSLLAWNVVPFLGPMIGPNVPGAVPPFPPDGQDELDDLKANIESTVAAWQDAITQVVGANALAINSIAKIFPSYIESITTLKLIPTEQNVTILFIEFISLAIIMMIIIFFGIHK
jgi:hypothetical protein